MGASQRAASGPLRDALLRAPGQPLCLVATALLLVNDHLLKARFPGLITGKLSDVAWLVVAPVVLAALLSLARVPARWARAGALAAVGIAFAALQLWPPLGEAWCALFGGHHVADLGDLLCLPALAGAWACWRGARVGQATRRWALVVGAGACLATHTYSTQDVTWRYPCDGMTGWSPAAPLVLHYAGETSIDTTAPGLAESMMLMDRDGRQVPVLLSARGDGLLVLCPEGGLEPEQRYLWWVRDTPFSYHHLPGPDAYYFSEGWSLTTGPEDGAVRARDRATCDALPLPEEAEAARVAGCDPCTEDTGWWSCHHPDTGDTGDSASDTGDSGDSGDDSASDTGDSGEDSAEPGDTGDSAADTGDTGSDTGEPDDTGLSPVDTGDGGLP